MRVITVAGAVLCSMQQGIAQRTVAEQYLFATLNTSRMQAGLPMLRWDVGLTAAAASHANAMRRAQTMTHRLSAEADLAERAADQGSRFSVIAENVGVGSNAPELQRMWMLSPHHRENMMDPAVDAVGIAVLEREGQVWAVEDFARIVPAVSLQDQEWQVVSLLQAAGHTAAPSAAARSMCEQSTGFVGVRPLFVLRYNATALTALPAELLERLRQQTVTQAAVGACLGPQSSFSSYSLAIALYR